MQISYTDNRNETAAHQRQASHKKIKGEHSA